MTLKYCTLDKTTDFLNELLRPFDDEINRNNVELFLSKPLLRKLPCFPDLIIDSNVLEDAYLSSIYSSRLSVIVSDAMCFKQSPGGEAITMEILIFILRKY